MKIFFSPRCLEYQYPGHPESPERIRATHAYLKKKGVYFSEPRPCEKEDILRVHSPDLLQALQTGAFFEPDTPALPGIFEYAKLSAGAAIMAAEAAQTEEPALSLMRPPGHHATRNRIMGFCYLNNMAIAIAYYIEKHPGTTAAIIDIDCHHGNGTEDIFRETESVLYVSLHQSPLYPGTGLESGSTTLNIPLPPGTGETGYLKALDIACRRIRDSNPSILGISAGFDTFQDDPLTHLRLDVDSYTKIGEMIAELKIPSFVVIEGGYSLRLPQCVFAFMEGLSINS